MSKEQKKDPENLTIITTHVNADFDALASMLAAQKLYPDGLVFFINSMAYLFNMADISDIDFAKVKRLVLVDTRQPRRIGKLAKLLKREDIDIHIYDHHPGTDNDIKGDLEIHRMSGANVTLLIEIISQKGIDISADEATIMCLGIYEDTGSFTFPSTTEKDFKAAAFLLSKGKPL
jgi:tRNA nucleotidyltransferase (CCA-adding enzyme)